ncbi:MAG: hypothetical protein JW782_02735 [Candidatus Saganbacteria bacterium]|nr:hypothetical protein [Candidatus Saganbacteria bacterium]
MINGIRYSSLARETCLAEGGLPMPEDHHDDLLPVETMPVTAPLRLISEHPEWHAVIAAAGCEIEPGRARDELNVLALDFFAAAYLAGRPGALSDWNSFTALLNSSPVQSPITTCLMRLGRSYLNTSDHGLFFDLITAPNGPERRSAERALNGRLVELVREDISEQNDWSSATDPTPAGRILSALEALYGPQLYEEALGRAVRPHLAGLMQFYGQDQLSRLIALPENELANLIVDTISRMETLPLGSAARRAVSDRYFDLSLVALSRGVSLELIRFNVFAEGIPGLEEADYVELYWLGYYADSPEHNDNLAMRQRFADQFTYFSGRLLSAEPGSVERGAYDSAICYMYTMGRSYGYSCAELDELFERVAAEHVVELEPDARLESLDDLDLFEPTTVGPEGLPPEVLEILDENGQLGLVINNLREIVLTPEIEEGMDLTVPDHGGEANAATRSVQIDFLTPEGELLPAWYIAYVLVHEAAHVAWGRNVRPLLLNVLPDERQAFLTGAAFLQSYYNNRIADGTLEPGSAEAEYILQLVQNDRLAGQAANLVLGYQEDDLDPYRFDLPSRSLLLSRGLNRASDLNMSVYPTNQAMSNVLEDLDRITAALDLPEEERAAVYDLFSRIIWQDEVVRGVFSEAEPGSDLALLDLAYDAVDRLFHERSEMPDHEIYCTSVDLLQLLTRVYLHLESGIDA